MSIPVVTIEDNPKQNGVSCSNCEACCCRLEVLLIGDESVPEYLTTTNEWGGQVMSRLEDGWCIALDRGSFRCTIYQNRPAICREFNTGDADCLSERSKWYIA